MNEKQEYPPALPALRVLVPVAFGSRGENGVRYALAEAARGRRVEVVLACVGDDEVRADVLRLRTRAEVADFLAAGAAAAMDEVAAPLRAAGIVVRTVFALGPLARELARIAEETGCDEIAVPARQGKLLPLTDPLAALARSGGVRLRVVDDAGRAH
ncbi:universal stress protein [Azospira restricta]|uniref:Universal stress protein n=1 Tax=Azospira restricta TaxID=404405 RepID=A0A974SS19_9RHOO|nr:universal stress protein [Azospira restricta]QRJ65349.1 universal stress protein [Azospira restricta]